MIVSWTPSRDYSYKHIIIAQKLVRERGGEEEPYIDQNIFIQLLEARIRRLLFHYYVPT